MKQQIKTLISTIGLIGIISCSPTNNNPQSNNQTNAPKTRTEEIYYIEIDSRGGQIGNLMGCGISVPINYADEITMEDLKKYARALPKGHTYQIIEESDLDKYRGKGLPRKTN